MEDRFEKMLGRVFQFTDADEDDALSQKIDEVLGDELSEDELFFVAAAGNGPDLKAFSDFVRNKNNANGRG